MRLSSPRRAGLILLLVAASLACQVIPTPPALTSTPRRPEPTTPALPRSSPTATPHATPAGPTASGKTSPGQLAPFPSQPGEPFASLAEITWRPGEPQPEAGLSLPVPWEEVENRSVADGLTQRQRERLRQEGFLILHSQEAGFGNIRQRVALRYGQPYYLTSDAAAHAVRLTLDELLIAVEKEELRRRLLAITQATLAEALSYVRLVPGGALEGETRLAAAYLGVGLRLLDAQASIDPLITGPVEDQVAQILAGRGVEDSTLIPGYRDDFSAYQPPGHYHGDPDLEAYYRALAWFSRVEWRIEASNTAPFASRVPLILTLALRRARIEDPGLVLNPDEPLSAAQEWARVAAVITFFFSPDLDDGPAEYAVLMDRVYGPSLTAVGLSDERAFGLFQVYARELPPVQQGSEPMAVLIDSPGERGWRFLGYGYRLDDDLLHRLAGNNAEGSPQPAVGLELFNLLGSSAASKTLQDSMASSDPAYSGRVALLQRPLTGFGDDFWLRSAPNAWLSLLASQAAEKGQAYPAQMRTSGWAFKDLNSALGAWAEQRRSPIANPVTFPASRSTPQEEILVSPPPPGFVEPDPETFYRLSQLANLAAEGLNQRGLTGIFAARPDPAGLKRLLLETLDLGDRLQRLGDIAARELDGQSPEKEDWALILAPLGTAEEQATFGSQPSEGQVPVGIAALEGPDGRLSQVANGWIDRIYVLVQLEGGLYIAQGGVHSYYEQPAALGRLLTDDEWRRRLNNPPAPLPLLAKELFLPEGNPVDVFAMRAGDVYRVQPSAGRVNLRAGPDRFSRSLHTLRPGDLFRLIDGPAQAGDSTWWQVEVLPGGDQPLEGWLIADPTWYARAW